MQIKVRSDKYKALMMSDSGKLYQDMGCEITPVDLYGKRVNLDKNDPSNLEKTAEDIQDHYGLDTPEEEASEVDDGDD